MQRLYPSLEPFDRYWVSTESQHRIYVEECGNPDGCPAVFLHGGPGSGCQPDHRRFFDPAYYRIILFDQRGAGRSTPLGETADNSTQTLLSDMETLRHRIKAERWLLFGGSWGATLALLYAEAFPQAVSGMILRGLFLARQRDLDWFFGSNGVCRLLPAAWSEFSSEIPESERADLVAAQHRRIHSSDRDVAVKAARTWLEWERAVVTWSTTKPGEQEKSGGNDIARILAKARVASHYARQRYFIEENQILRVVDRLPRVPVSIVHGSRDVTCPPEAAWLLHRALPGSRLLMLDDAGHLMSEPTMTDALVRETDRMRRQI